MYKALEDNVVVEYITPDENISEGGIITGEQGESLLTKARVLSVGKKCHEVSEGDIVLVHNNRGEMLDDNIYVYKYAFMVVKLTNEPV